jgi:hypothetical protein
MSLRVSATTLEGFRLYLTEDWKAEEELLAEIRGEFKPTPKMMLGRSGHCAVEGRPAHEDPGGHHTCYGFRWTPATIAECRRSFVQGGLAEVKVERTLRVAGEDVTLVGKADRCIGTQIVEHKFTESTFSPDRYHDSYQWRVYDLLFRPSSVLYTVFCVAEGDGNPPAMDLRETHSLTLWPYRECERDVADLLEKFVGYVDQRGLRAFLQPRPTHEAA